MSPSARQSCRLQQETDCHLSFLVLFGDSAFGIIKIYLLCLLIFIYLPRKILILSKIFKNVTQYGPNDPPKVTYV